MLDDRSMYVAVMDRHENENISLEDSCKLYAKENSLDEQDCWKSFISFSGEVQKAKDIFKGKLSEAIKKSEVKQKELEDKIGPRSRYFDDWEKEIIDLAFKANPMLPKTAVGFYLADVLPHRTAKAYLAYQSRDAKAKLATKGEDAMEMNNNLKIGSIVDCTVMKVLPYGAILSAGSGQTGLLHKSEINDTFVENVEDYVVEGQKIKAKVILDKKSRTAFSTKTVDNIQKSSSFSIQDAIPRNVSTELQKRYKLKETKFSELPTILGGLIKDLETEREAIQNRIDTIRSIMDSVTKEAESVEKFYALKKYLTEL